MTPKKKIPSFCFEYPWLKPMELNLNSITVGVTARTLHATWTPELTQDISAYNIDVEAELTRMLSEELSREINRNALNTIQPLIEPQGQLFYLDFQYGDLVVEKPKIYSDGSWSIGNTFESAIGINIKISPHTLI
jgi:hypothetical protein